MNEKRAGLFMNEIELDATRWEGVTDFYNDLLAALGSPEWHGRNVNALVDSIVWGGINAVNPPIRLRIHGVQRTAVPIRQEVEWLQKDLSKACSDYWTQNGRKLDIQIELL